MLRCLLLYAITHSLSAQTPNIVLKATTDRPTALYQVGETARFDITVTQDGKPMPQGQVQCSFSKDGVEPRRMEKLVVQDGHASLTATLAEPGFLLLRVDAPGQKVFAQVAAGFSPQDIRPSLPVPDDFDTFWSAQKTALAQVEMKATLTPVSSPAKGVDAFDVQVTCLGAPVSGYYGKPQAAKAKSCPAILFVHGAGVSSSSLAAVAWSTREGGLLSMDINAHGLPNGRPKDYYAEQEKGDLNGYRFIGRADREQCYFKGMFLRLIRALDFLTAQPEWDGKTLIVYGSSQGGYQAIAAAGLDPRVSYICAGVPAGCDHTGTAIGRINGWPKLVTLIDGKPVEAEFQTARYFDNVNFAQRAQCRGAAFTVGFIDTVCPPTGVYAAYNALTVPKRLYPMPLTGHKSSPEASTFMTEAALAHIRAMRQP